MKINKQALKRVIKECLIEILAESCDVNEARAHRPLVSSNVPRPQRTALPPQIDPMTTAVKACAGGDSIMESVLADTAVTSLPIALSADRMGSHMVGVQASPQGISSASGVDISVSEESNAAWAAIAFAPPKSK